MGKTLVIWHGYLLGGTGSNIYSANIIREWVGDGHNVIVFCQDPHPELHGYIHEYRRVENGECVEQRLLTDTRPGEGEGRCTMVQTELNGALAVYLIDRYEGFDSVKRCIHLSDDEIAVYRTAYQASMQYVLDEFSPSGVLINHAVPAPNVLRPVLEAANVPYVVKVHGSELEYAIAEDSRLVPPARAGLAGASAVLVGSEHIQRRTDELLGEECTGDRIHLVPPGVDLDLFQTVPDSEKEAIWDTVLGLMEAREYTGNGRTLAQRTAARVAGTVAFTGEDLADAVAALHGTYEERDPEVGAVAQIRTWDFDNDKVVVFVGKLIHQKGVVQLLSAWPVVRMVHPNARLIMVGFGQLRDVLDSYVAALANGDWATIRRIIMWGQGFDSPSPAPLAHMQEFCNSLDESGALGAYLAAAAGMLDDVVFTGQHTHDVLANLWPLCQTSIVPSVNAEAFGMVSAEAAACGCPPILAHHSGLADVAQELIDGYPEDFRDCVSYDPTDNPIYGLAAVIVRILSLSDEDHDTIAEAAREVVVSTWSWRSIARQIAETMTAGTPAR